MSTPAERYEASLMRHAESKSVLAAFKKIKNFDLDNFQIDACKALESGRGVLVAAPTGSGKTVVGEFAIYLARHLEGKAFYTTPIKALSNQKFNELVEVYGADSVGLLTGDVSINPDAPIIVMTTEVLRNMLYVNSTTLLNLKHVVMDEVHYLADRSRGAVWEEVILHLPESVAVTALSATVSNAEEFGQWLTHVRGDTAVIVEEHRPVPLWQLVAAGRNIHDLFIDEEQRKVNPDLLRIAREGQNQQRGRDSRGRRGNRGGFSRHTPFRDHLIKQLDKRDLLPAIFFIFSRKGCDQAVEQCVEAGLRLTSIEERDEIRYIVDNAVADLPSEDLAALNFSQWLQALEWGIAAHHAGLIPRFKEVVETLFQQGLLKVVFATETLALGINMPARSVVIDKLRKWNGDAHVDLSPGEYTQLTGRAGRRGIDDEGNAIVVWQDGLDPVALAGLASTRTYPLKSSFTPGYTMAVNIISSMGYDRAVELLGSSFAQFQADRGVAGLNQQLRKMEEGLGGYKEAMECHLGDFFEYAAIRNKIAEVEKNAVKAGRIQLRQETAVSLSSLVPGDVIVIQTGRRAGPAVVLDPGTDFAAEPRPLVLTMQREVRRLSVSDFTGMVLPVERIKIPRNFDSRSSRSRQELVNVLRRTAFDAPMPRRNRQSRESDVDIQIGQLRAEMRAHACHGCSDREEHARWSERYFKLVRERDAISSQISHRVNVISRDFERVCNVLNALGYIEGQKSEMKVTDTGKVLRRVHAESELLITEALRRGFFNGMDAAELASAVSVLVYESRGDDDGGSPKLPFGKAEEAIVELFRLWQEIHTLEGANKLNTVRKPDAGFAWAIYRWANGGRLTGVLRDSELSAGDFVRTTRRLIDVLEQIAAVGDHELSPIAHESVDLVRRGIVSAAELED